MSENHNEEQSTTAEQQRHPRRFVKARDKERPVYLRRERRPGWSAKLPLYVIWCPECALYSVTHPAGYGRIACHKCHRYHRVMTWQRFRDKTAPTLLPVIVLCLAVLFLLRLCGVI